MQNANVSAKAANFKNDGFLLIHSMADGKFTINGLMHFVNCRIVDVKFTLSSILHWSVNEQVCPWAALP